MFDDQGEHDGAEGEAAGDAERNGVSKCERKGLRGTTTLGRGGGGDYL